MTDAVGNVTQFEYDNLYRLTSLIEEDPDGAGPLDHPITTYIYDVASQLLTESDPLSRATSYEYDDLGRVSRWIQPDPDGPGQLAAPEMSYAYDLMNNQLSMTDPLGHVTRYEYDNLYRMTRQIDEDLDGPAGPLSNPTTTFAYNLVDNMLSLTDPVGNTTTYVYDDLDRVITETIELGTGNFTSRRYEYDRMNNLVQSTDRNDRVIEYGHDRIYRMVEERWLDDVGTTVNVIQFDFDEASQMLRAEDVTIGSRYDNTYDDLSRVTQTVVSNGGPAIVFASAYDAQSRRTEHSAVVGGLADFNNVYSYDGLNRLARFDQVAQAGGAVVAPKRFDFQYNADDQFTRISRYDDVSGGPADLVVESTLGYDGIGRLIAMTHSNQTSTVVDYDWSFDAASRITRFVSSVDGVSGYNYDNGDQLTGASHDVQTDESYDYDENGNRTSAGYATGFYNRLSSDGTYTYQYDAEGNRTRHTNIATGAVTEYLWDHRNRLVAVIDRDSAGGGITQEVLHRYDVFNRWISKSVDMDGAGPLAFETTNYEYDANQIVLVLDDTGSVTNRYAWGPAVDQILADEQMGGDVLYPLADQLGTVRDLVTSDGAVANHFLYDSFGQVTSETAPTTDHLFGFTGRAFDESTSLQNNLHRWYDAKVGRWINHDPIGFAAGDANLYRYVGNQVIVVIDPDGLEIWIVARQFGFSEAESPYRQEQLYQHNKRWFEGPAKVAHFYILIEKDDGSLTSFSWHPSEWPKGDPVAPWHKIAVQKDNLIDANEPRPGRIWRDHPADLYLKIGNKELSHQKWLLNTNPGDEEKLIEKIAQWQREQSAGLDEGRPRKDPTNPNNTIGLDAHVPAKRKTEYSVGDPAYWVYGQNCGWWATKMATKVGASPSRQQAQEMKAYNMGVGPSDRFNHNDAIRNRFKGELGSKFYNVKQWLGGGSKFGPDLMPQDLYPIVIESGPLGGE